METSRRAYLLTGDQASFEAGTRAHVRADEGFKRVKALSERWRNLPPLVQQVAAEYRAWVRTGQTELRVRRQGAGAAALVEAQRRADRHFRELCLLQARFEDQLAGAQYSYARNQDRTYETAQTLAVRTALMMLAALVLLAVWLRRAVGAPADALPLPSLRAGQVVGLADLDEVATTNALHELVAKLGVRSLALVPLLSRGRFLGLLALCWTERHQLDREQEALLGLAGNQIAGALEAALRLEEAERAAGEARAVFYAIADGVLLSDPYGRVTAMNRALEALTGWTEAEARGRPYAEVLPTATDQVGGPADLVSRYGRKVPVAVSSAPIFDPRGRVVGGVDVIRDVSREREIDEVKSALISTVSHELRTPLTLIHGFAELLVLRDMPVERQRSSAVEILDASRRLARLIDDLLSVSRMESGRLVLDPRPLDLAAVVERILSPFRAMAAKHTLRTKLPGNLPVIWGDPDKVEQILTNLVGNAIKYSPGGGEVLVTVDHDGDTVQVSVRDQGIGMSPRDMGQLFEKFYRVDRDEVRRAGGTGLGLYITKRLVEMHGGRLWAESWPGVGSVFRFTLPTSDELAGSGR